MPISQKEMLQGIIDRMRLFCSEQRIWAKEMARRGIKTRAWASLETVDKWADELEAALKKEK